MWSIVASIFRYLTGGEPHSGKTLETCRQQAKNTRGGRGRGNRGRGGTSRGRGRGDIGERGGRVTNTGEWGQRQEVQMATKSGTDMQEEEEEGYGEGEKLRGAPVAIVCVGGCVPPLEESTDLSDFIPERAYMLFQGVYGDLLHHNDR